MRDIETRIRTLVCSLRTHWCWLSSSWLHRSLNTEIKLNAQPSNEGQAKFSPVQVVTSQATVDFVPGGHLLQSWVLHQAASKASQLSYSRTRNWTSLSKEPKTCCIARPPRESTNRARGPKYDPSVGHKVIVKRIRFVGWM